MRLLYKILIGIVCFLFPIVFMLALILIFKITWWLLIGDLIFEFIALIVLGIVLLVLKLSKKIELPKGLTINDQKQRAVNELKNDEHNPDNFNIKKAIYYHDDTGKPLVLILRGIGTEKQATIIAVINLKSVNQEISWINDPQLDSESLEKNIEEQIKRIIGTYKEQIKEEIITKDVFGNPVTTKTTTRPSEQEIKKEQDKNQAEEKNIT